VAGLSSEIIAQASSLGSHENVGAASNLIVGSSIAAAAAGCSLLVSTDGLSGGRDAADADVVLADAGDASADDVQTPDAPAASRRCDAPPAGTIFCEDFDRGFLASSLHCESGTSTLTPDSPASPPNALLLRTTAAGGGCLRDMDLGPIARGVRESFRLRLGDFNGRIHLFSLKVTAGNDTSLLYINVYPDHVALGQGVPASGGGIKYTERATAYRPIPHDQWIDVSVTIAGLDASSRGTLVFDGTTLDDGAPLPFAPGTGDVALGVSYADTPSTVEIDDVLLERL